MEKADRKGRRLTSKGRELLEEAAKAIIKTEARKT